MFLHKRLDRDRAIRARYNYMVDIGQPRGLAYKQISKAFEMSPRTIRAIVNRRYWYSKSEEELEKKRDQNLAICKEFSDLILKGRPKVWTYTHLAKKYGISPSSVRYILS